MTARAATPRAEALHRLHIEVTGAVQGVGYRPFVRRLADRYGLTGWVANTLQGVALEVEGTSSRLEAFRGALAVETPKAARTERISARTMPPEGGTIFEIQDSDMAGVPTTVVPPDLATCPACLAEILDPGNRRYRYPFTNCTDCGPRYSLIEALPYDRMRTTMRRFRMCTACRREYEDPADRRFHAEPNACPACGPGLAFTNEAGKRLAAGDAALEEAAAALAEGRIVAVKGLGGFHLLVDAGNEAAVARLRARKRRPDKPLAVMFPDIAGLRACCVIEDEETALLTAPQAPIVLLRRRGGAGIAQTVAPGNPRLGAFLPYTPLHHLLLRAVGRPLVATSGNRSDEPIATDGIEAQRRLAGIADLFLDHDRPIVRPVDDSVVRVVAGRTILLRRARGYAPLPIHVADMRSAVLALGGHLKTAVALGLDGRAVLSQHLGDMDSPESRTLLDRTADDLARLHGQQPRIVACDRHPDYHTTDVAERRAGTPVRVPHHLAHLIACMADNGISGPILGAVWDGSGYGADGTVWGGEFLLVEDRRWHRVGRFRHFRLPGAEQAVREPCRAALGLLYEAFGPEALGMNDLPPVAAFEAGEREVLGTMLARGVNAPRTSSVGRLFDAVAALTGLCQRSSYEGQAASMLEWAAEGADAADPYPFPLREERSPDDMPLLVVDWEPALVRLIADLRAGVPAGAVATAFHAGLAACIVTVARASGEIRMALSGGCFQNGVLATAAADGLEAAGIEPVLHREVPPNDGGIALGQLVWASRTAAAETH